MLVEECGRVQPAGRGEDALRLPHARGQLVEQARQDAYRIVQRPHSQIAQRVELRSSADTASAPDREMALETRAVCSDCARPALDGDDIVLLLRIEGGVEAITHTDDVVARPHDRFVIEEARGELEVVAGRAHRDRQRARRAAVAQRKLQRLLRHDLVALARLQIAFECDDVGFDAAAAPPGRMRQSNVVGAHGR